MTVTPRTIVLLCLLAAWCITPPRSASPGSSHKLAAVPALSVVMFGERLMGTVHYIVIQIDEDPQAQGPTVAFNELAAGSAVGDDWKEGVRTAVIAASRLLGEDPRRWNITVRNRSNSIFTEGSSASAAIAVGLLAAWRGETLAGNVVMTGRITADGRIREVDGLPAKLDGAAQARMQVVLVPRGQAHTSEWDLVEQGRQRNVRVLEVESLSEAYDLMVARRP